MRETALALCSCTLLLGSIASAAAPPVEWKAVYPQLGFTQGLWMDQTMDQGFIIVGRVKPDTGVADYLLVKTDPLGNLEWSRSYGVGMNAWAYSVRQTSDNGYIVAGSRRLDASAIASYVLKTDPMGNKEWDLVLRDSCEQFGCDIIQIDDGSYVFSGWKGFLTEYLAKVSQDGQLAWRRFYNGNYRPGQYPQYSPFRIPMQPTSDGGYILAGRKETLGVRLIKTDSGGNLVWDHVYPGLGFREAAGLRQTTDHGFILAGLGYSPTRPLDPGDIYLVKTDSLGEMQWKRTFGGEWSESATDVRQTSDRGYILTGMKSASRKEGIDGYVVRTDTAGQALWTTTIGDPGHQDVANCVLQTSDGGYAITGGLEVDGTSSGLIFLLKLRPESQK